MNTRLLQKARNAIARCTNAKHPQWQDYGGRGIQVLFTSAREFAEHIATLPGAYDTSLVLDRKANDGHYERGNLQFVTRTESTRNRRYAGEELKAKILATLADNAGLLTAMRGDRPKKLIALRAGVPMCYVSRIEGGDARFLSTNALICMLRVYMSLDPNNLVNLVLKSYTDMI